MTDLLERIGISLPIVQAPMAGTSTPALAAAVTEAGGLGSIGVGATNVHGAREMIESLRSRTDGPFNVNVFCHRPAAARPDVERAWLDALRPVFARFGAEPPAAIHEIYKSFLADAGTQELLIALRPKVVSFHFGLPKPDVVARLNAAGIVLLSTATNLAEAQCAAAAGIDAVVAQGFEAGGHRGVFDPDLPDPQLGTLALTRLLVERVELPVIAAGGIMDGAGIAAALKLGAVAAQLGTAFIACPESSADAHFRAALFGPGAASTQMTAAVSGRPARSLPNAMTALTQSVLAGVAVPDYPIAYDANKALAAAAKAKGVGGFGAQWAGQGAPLARALPVKELVAALVKELVAALAEEVRSAR
ncbi:MAG: nitronate monooxygenase [Alphaproteobacteria bacterium]|nr:nitronate monooxygenase [Alphaproteobacteria bacterium]